jgi:hypothetical protein
MSVCGPLTFSSSPSVASRESRVRQHDAPRSDSAAS